MPKFLGTALDIPAATTSTQAVRKGYVDSADSALSARVAVLEAGSGATTGGQTLAVRAVSTAATAAAGDFILADASSAPFTITLPAAPPTNTSIAVKKVDSGLNLVTVVGSGGTTIDGDADLTLVQPQSGAALVYDGTNWRVESTVIFDPGAKNFTYRGTWDNSVAYGINDVVFYSGGGYLAILANTNVAPVAGSSTATWGQLVQPGATGAQGPAGPSQAIVYPITTVTTAYTIVTADRVILANSASGFVITLPSAVTEGSGKVFSVKNINTGTVTMASVAGTVDGGAAGLVTIAQWAVRTFISNGTNWFLM